MLCYTQALFDLSSRELEVIEENVQFLLTFLKGNKKMVSFLSNPANSILAKNDIILLLKNYVNDTLLDFMLLVTKNGRFSLLESIFEKFLILIKKFKNEIDVTVKSVVPLNKKDIKLISNSMFNFGKVVGFVNVIDPTILGGFIIRVNFTIIDASLKSYLGRLLSISKEAILLRGV